MNTRITKLAAMACLAAAFGAAKIQAATFFVDNFESYPVQSPAPNPLTNGPAGGQWWFVDPTPPTIAANEHRIYASGTGGSALQSRCWISSINNCTITNAISIPALPAGTNVSVFTVSFLAATDTTTAGRTATFRYQIASSGGGLAFISGGNADFSQNFIGLDGYGVASTGSTGKSDDRKFSVQFFATNLTTDDKIFVSLTRVTNAGASGAFVAFDDVTVGVKLGAPEVVVQPQPSIAATAGDTVVFSAVVTNFPDSYQWTRNGEPVAGATAATYTIPFVTKPDEGTYILWATNTEGFASSSSSVLTVTDATAPTLAQITGVLTLEHARVRFSEPVDPESATNASYTMNNGATVSTARLADPFTVEITTSALAPATAYTVTVSNVKDLANNMIAPGSSSSFTTPALVISPVRYDAGTTTTKPSGPDDPVSAAGGYWLETVNTNVGLTASAVLDDLGTGLNAWKIQDQNVLNTSGILDYRMAIDQPSDDLARSNGWRLVVRARMIDNFGGNDSVVVLYSDIASNRRYGFYLGLDASFYLTAGFLGGTKYTLTADSTSYHTHMLIFDPATTTFSYYFDGQFITSSYTGQTAGTAYNGLTFGSGSGTGSGEANFNLVQLDVVGGTRPVLVSSPEDSTNGVGQKATFTAQFTPFVSAYQWLSNGVVIPGATSNSFTTDFLTLAMDGDKFRCRALHALGNVESAEATLTVTSDTNPPTVLSAKASLLLDRVSITFSEPVLPLYATNVANYAWVNPGMTNASARLLDPLTVELRTSPMEADSNYTVRVSNIRDTSNLVIANNTPASFKTAKLQVLARYDAGTTTTRPDGPPEPGSVDGGSWVVEIGTDPGLMTNAVLDDFGTGYHAWQATDQTTALNQFIRYNMPFTPEQQAAMRANGWVMSVRSRFVDDFGGDISVMTQAGDALGNRNLLWFDFANGEFYLRPQGAADQVVTSGGLGLYDYHLHQVVFNPATTNASVYIDGELRVSGWAGDVSANTYPGLQWGTGSSANQGSMNFNLVEFKLVEPPVRPSVAASLNGGNVEVQYIGILEAAGTVDGTWSPIATNATASPVIYSVPANGQPQQFFRAHSAE